MEITPTLLLAMGDGPVRAVLRFKEDAAWRPRPARQAVQALLIGAAPPPPAAGLAARLAAWREDCHWLPPRRGWDAAWLAEGLRPAWDRALSARELDRLRRLPGYRPRVLPHHERFAPDVCLLAAAAGPEIGHLEGVIAAAAAATYRPIHLVLALPAPHDAEWGQAVVTVARLSALGRSRPHLLGRVWLASRERATGELLEPADLEGALAHFCRLFAYAGRSGDPLLARLFRTQTGEPVWGTFGVQALAWPIAERHPRALVAAAQAVLAATAGTAPPDADPGPGLGALADPEERDPVLRRALPPVPAPPSPHSLPPDEIPAVMEGWWAGLGIAWPAQAQAALDVAAGRLRQQVQDALAQHWEQRGGTPQARLAGLDAARDRVRRAQEDLAPPPPDPGVAWAMGALGAAALQRIRWIPAAVRAVMSTALAVAGARVLSGPPAVLPTLVVAVTAWTLWLLLRHVLDRRRLSARLEDLIGAVQSWAAARGAEAAYYAALSALRGLESWLEERRQADAALAALLADAGGVLAGLAPAASGPADPATTRLVDPVGCLEFSGIAGLAEDEVPPADAVAAAGMALDRAQAWLDAGGVVAAVHAPLARAMSAMAAEEPGPAPVLLPLRLALPESGEPLPALTVSLTGLRPPPDLPRWPDEHQVGDDPFALVRMTLCAPIPLSGTLALAGLREGEDSA